MRTTSLKNRKGEPRYRKEQQAEAEAYSKAWGEYRKTLFEAGATEFPTFEFSVSNGIPIELRDANGLKEKNHVGDVLIHESLIPNQANLIIIPRQELLLIVKVRYKRHLMEFLYYNMEILLHS